MALFGDLKTSVKHIHSEVSELKNKVQPIFLFRPDIFDPAPNIPGFESEEIDIKVSGMESEVKNIRGTASKFKAQFKKKQDLIKEYSYCVEDLYLDIISNIADVEKKLVKFGYCPLKIDVPSEDSEELPMASAENDKGRKVVKSTTPKLMIVKNFATKDIDKTPVLCLDGPFNEGNELTTEPVNSTTVVLSRTKSYDGIARKLEFPPE